ncbi:MAG: sulfotransferase family 2 domain-containing protein [Pseudomonadota bacterium]
MTISALSNRLGDPVDLFYRRIPEGLFPVSPLHRIIHIHVPKTAGTSIRRALFGSDVVRHVPAARIPIGLWEAMPSITVVRNPIARFLSNYNYHVKSGYRGTLMDAHPTMKSWSVAEYVDRLLEDSDLLSPQRFFITRSDSTKPMVDEVVRFEDMDRALPAALSKHGVAVEILHLKKGVAELPSLDKVTMARIRDHYAEDFEAFGY